MFDLYKIIPKSWNDCKLWQIPFWVLFGNDEDGIYGERGGVPSYQGVAPSYWQFVRWQTRNPAHNLFFHVLSIPMYYSVCLLGTPETPANAAPKGNGAILALNVLPFFSYRNNLFETYIGLRPMSLINHPGKTYAVFGMAFRKRSV